MIPTSQIYKYKIYISLTTAIRPQVGGAPPEGQEPPAKRKRICLSFEASSGEVTAQREFDLIQGQLYNILTNPYPQAWYTPKNLATALGDTGGEDRLSSFYQYCKDSKYFDTSESEEEIEYFSESSIDSADLSLLPSEEEAEEEI